MVGADHLRIVFRVNGTGFVMPVADLLAIRGPDEDPWTMTSPAAGSLKIGTLVYRETEIAIYDLSALFELGACPDSAKQLLIFAGADGPWAVPVDHVEGVVDVSAFTFQELPGYMFRDGMIPYQAAAIYENQLLVSADVLQIDNAWRRGE